MSDLMSLFFMEWSNSHIKNTFKTFQNIVYALIYAQQLLIMCSLHALEHTATQHTHHLVAGTWQRKFNERELGTRGFMPFRMSYA